MKILRYKGYEANVQFDPDANIVHGHVLGTRDVITFQSDAWETVEHEFHLSVDDYLAFCQERGESPNKPYSGLITFRTRPDVHRQIAYAVEREGDCSESKWIERARVNQIELDRMASASGSGGSPGIGQLMDSVSLSAAAVSDKIRG